MDVRQLLTVTEFKLRNLAGTILSAFVHSSTVARTYTFPDKDITVAGTSDIITIHPNLSNLSWENSGHTASSGNTIAGFTDTGTAKLFSVSALAIEIGKILYPVGCIAEFNVSTNPTTLLGFGTWTLHGVGRVTVCIDTNQTEFDTLSETGGAKTHTLIASEIPSHVHSFSATTSSNGAHVHGYHGGDGNRNSDSGSDWNKQGLNLGDGKTGGTTTSNGAHTHTISGTTETAGSGSAHNNLQPYIVVYRWVRTE